MYTLICQIGLSDESESNVCLQSTVLETAMQLAGKQYTKSAWKQYLHQEHHHLSGKILNQRDMHNAMLWPVLNGISICRYFVAINPVSTIFFGGNYPCDHYFYVP